MNILIITPFYKQDRNIASVRWTSIAQRLSTRHNVIVVTQPLDDMDQRASLSNEDGILVARVNQKTRYEKIAVKHFGGATGEELATADAVDLATQVEADTVTRRIKNRVLYLSMRLKAREYARQIVKDVIPQGMNVDVVISSACPFIEMLFGYEAKRLLGCKWISDFRDWPYRNPEETSDDVQIMRGLLRRRLAKSDAVTVVTRMMRDLASDEALYPYERVFTITNGYSLEDRALLSANDDVRLNHRGSEKLRLVHTGSLYGGKCKSDMLFCAIRMLKDKELCHKIVFECAGGNNSSLIAAAEKYDVGDVVVDRGFVSRQKALEMQASADCLVSIIVNNAGGGFNGKLLEYMLWEKPIINIAVGEARFGEATQVVRELRMGIAVEEENWDQDVTALAEYLELQIRRKLRGQKLLFTPDCEGIARYNYDNIARSFESLCQSIVTQA